MHVIDTKRVMSEYDIYKFKAKTSSAAGACAPCRPHLHNVRACQQSVHSCVSATSHSSELASLPRSGEVPLCGSKRGIPVASHLQYSNLPHARAAPSYCTTRPRPSRLVIVYNTDSGPQTAGRN